MKNILYYNLKVELVCCLLDVMWMNEIFYDSRRKDVW